MSSRSRSVDPGSSRPSCPSVPSAGPSRAGGARALRALAALASALLLVGAPSAARALDLSEAFAAARGIDAVVASSRSQLAAVRERLPQARALQLPSASATAGVSRQVLSIDDPPERLQYSPLTFGLNLSYPLYRPANDVLVDQATLQAELAELQLAAAEQDLAVRVAQAYFNLLAALDGLRTVRAQNRATSEQFESARRSYEAGTTTITDQREARARLDLGRALEVAASNELAIRRSALSQLIGRPVQQLAVLKQDIELLSPVPADLSQWTGAARARNPAVRQAELSARIASREIDRARFAHRPTLDVVSSLQRARDASESTIGERITRGLVGLQLAVPIYSGGGIEARVREAIALHERAQNDLDNARRVAEQSTRQLFLTVGSGLEQVAALEEAERSSQVALESNLVSYRVGVRINIDVLNAQQQLFTIRRDLSRARYDVLVNTLALQAQTGELSAQAVERVNRLLMQPGR